MFFKDGGREVLDPERLAFGYHRSMMQALEAASKGKQSGRRIACLGLGGGAMPRYLLARDASIEMVVAVEIEKAVIEAARHFDSEEPATSSRLDMVQGDAQDQVRTWANSVRGGGPPLFEAVLIDIDACDQDPRRDDDFAELSAPPSVFLSTTFLSDLRVILSPNGVAVFNVLPKEGPLGQFAAVRATCKLKTYFGPGALQLPAEGGEANVVVAGVPHNCNCNV